jgi:hypothetical protein
MKPVEGFGVGKRQLVAYGEKYLMVAAEISFLVLDSQM